jgi:hypothetical protein
MEFLALRKVPMERLSSDRGISTTGICSTHFDFLKLISAAEMVGETKAVDNLLIM